MEREKLKVTPSHPISKDPTEGNEVDEGNHAAEDKDKCKQRIGKSNRERTQQNKTEKMYAQPSVADTWCRTCSGLQGMRSIINVMIYVYLNMLLLLGERIRHTKLMKMIRSSGTPCSIRTSTAFIADPPVAIK